MSNLARLRELAERIFAAHALRCGRTMRSANGAARDDAVVLERFYSTLGLVESRAVVLKRSVGPLGFVTLDDLRGFGREGLLQAARTYDDARGVPFGAWAEIRVKRAMLDGIRQWGPRRGERRSRRLELDEGSIEDERASDPEQLTAQAQLKAKVRSAVAQLPADQREIVQRFDVEGQSLGHAAAAAGVSKSWASRLRARAHRLLAEAMGRKSAKKRELRSRESAREAQHEMKPAASMAEQSASFADSLAAKAGAKQRVLRRSAGTVAVDGTARMQPLGRRSRAAPLQPMSGQARSNPRKAKSSEVERQADGILVMTTAATVTKTAVAAKGRDDGHGDEAGARDAVVSKTGSSDAQGRDVRDPVQEPQRPLWAAARRVPAVRFLLAVWTRWRQNLGAKGVDRPSSRGVGPRGAEPLLDERDHDPRAGPYGPRRVRRPRDGPVLHHGRLPNGRPRPRETILDRRARLRADRAQTTGLPQLSA